MGDEYREEIPISARLLERLWPHEQLAGANSTHEMIERILEQWIDQQEEQNIKLAQWMREADKRSGDDGR